ncbi:MAG: reverse transcriptase family protein [Planctomycetota bacterium]
MRFFARVATFLGDVNRLVRAGSGLTVEDLASRLNLEIEEIAAARFDYHCYTIPKRSGGHRQICAPEVTLKMIQRRILRRLLKKLKSHPCATGFEAGRSIVSNANAHVGAAVVLRMDIKDFFNSTRQKRVRRFFSSLGWNRFAARLLTELCTYEGSLPQGAPTSPRLSNLVNYPLDTRLAGAAEKLGATYTRYADDITFSFKTDRPRLVSDAIRRTKLVLADYGYRIHHKLKLSVRRRHQQQRVTGLVVNQCVNLPRKTRRWLRAVRHHHATGRMPTLTEEQLAGWTAIEEMVAKQANK